MSNELQKDDFILPVQKYWLGGRRWTPITKDYFETILVDFFGRPDGWWHLPLLLEVPDKIGIHCKPKKHNNYRGYTRDHDGKFKPCRWVDFEVVQAKQIGK